jgi:hypothetical protein
MFNYRDDSFSFNLLDRETLNILLENDYNPYKYFFDKKYKSPIREFKKLYKLINLI